MPLHACACRANGANVRPPPPPKPLLPQKCTCANNTWAPSNSIYIWSLALSFSLSLSLAGPGGLQSNHPHFFLASLLPRVQLTATSWLEPYGSNCAMLTPTKNGPPAPPRDSRSMAETAAAQTPTRATDSAGTGTHPRAGPRHLILRTFRTALCATLRRTCHMSACSSLRAAAETLARSDAAF